MSGRPLLLLLILLAAVQPAQSAPDDGMVLLPAGSYTPLYLESGKPGESGKAGEARQQTTPVEAFWLDRLPVTNRQYMEFVVQHPAWRKSRVKRIFADAGYLRYWSGDLTIRDVSELDSPVVDVSWFAASAYCEAQGKRLPTTDEWEYALADNGRGYEAVQKQFLDWCSAQNARLPKAGSTPANGYGIHDLVGSVWEWSQDFNSFMSASDSRDKGSEMFCGGASLNTTNPRDYAAFMRFSYRASLQGSFTGNNLGFRCAKEAK